MVKASLKDLQVGKLKDLYAYWESRRTNGRKMPSKASIDPCDIPTLLSHIAIARVVKDDNNDMADPLIQYRIVGTLLTEHVGKELRGVWLHEIGYHNKPNPIKELYYEAIDTKSPTIDRMRYKGIAKDNNNLCDMLVLPLADDGENVDNILIMACFIDSKIRTPFLESAYNET